jgi:hypothetical protein
MFVWNDLAHPFDRSDFLYCPGTKTRRASSSANARPHPSHEVEHPTRLTLWTTKKREPKQA